MVMGLAIGFAISMSEENKHKNELRPLTLEEEEVKRKAIHVLLGLLLLGIIMAAILFLS
jgi:hypothetical protein